jgi:hypothetical protein
MQFSATLTGADKIRLGIHNIGAALSDIDLADVKSAMETAAKVSVPYRGGNSYDVPATRSYERTGNLGRSVVVYQRGASTVIEASAYRRGREYTTYVIGDRNGEGQAEVHKGRWTTMDTAVNLQLLQLVDVMDKHNQELIDREVG